MGRIYKKNLNSSDIFSNLLLVGPCAWALIRIEEIYLLSGVTFTHPVLDLACGDGSFAAVLMKHQGSSMYDVGTDIDTNELRKAKKSGSYKKVVFADASKLPFKNDSFATIFSNGSVEHFSNFEACLSEIHRVLRKDGICYLTVPSNNVARYLFVSRTARLMRLGIFADMYEVFFNWLFKHKNLLSHTGWKKVLLRNNLQLVSYAYYNFDPVLPAHDILLWFNSWNFIVKKITGNWFLFPQLRKYTAPIERILFQSMVNVSSNNTPGPSIFLTIKK